MAGIDFKFRPDMALKQTVLMMEQGFLELRAQAAQRYISHSAAEQMKTSVVSRIPKTKEYSSYRDALKIVQSGLPSNPVFSLSAESSERPIEAKRDLLVFRAQKRGGRIDPVVAVLLEHQPWTKDTLPFQPSPKNAEMISRRVSRDDVESVSKRLEATRAVWTQKLLDLGVRPKPKADIPEEATAVPDLTFTALRLEYGLGRTRAVAHWRPAIKDVMVRVNSLFMSRNMESEMIDWQDNTWRTWSRLGAEPVSTSEVEAFGRFQSKLGQ